MGSFRGRGNSKGKNSSGSGFSRPRLPNKRGGGKSSKKDGGKSPLVQHFFFWVVILSSFIGVFGTFQTQISAWTLFYQFYILFGVFDYWTVTIGWTIAIMLAMCIDMLLVADSK